MKLGYFTSEEESHNHSLETLNLLFEYDDFMLSVSSMADLGCGIGLDLKWWATRCTRDEKKRPLNIRCTGIDEQERLPIARQYHNVNYQRQNFEDSILYTNTKVKQRTYDVLWCHDAFQYVLDPLHTLKKWYQALNKNGMLILILPQTTNIHYREQAFDQRDFCYYHWTLVNLIHVLSVTGFDCADGFFRKLPHDPWLHAVVYRSDQQPRDPHRTTWYDLAESGLLPESAVSSIQRHGYLRQRDLILPWLDRSLTSYLNQ